MGRLLVDVQLRFDVAARILFELVGPGIDEIDGVAGTDAGAVGEPAVVAGSDAVAVESGGAIGHGGCPFADDDVVGGSGAGVGVGVGADEVAVFLFGAGGLIVVEGGRGEGRGGEGWVN